MQRISLANMTKDQKGITGLETAIVLIAFVVVGAVFVFTVITTGLFSPEKVSEATTASLGEVEPSNVEMIPSAGAPFTLTRTSPSRT
jgi:flagellin-like protein